jgi:iron complex outermembrane receptor protein
MSKKILHSLFATTALAIALPTVAFAQEAPADEATAGDETIIVNARRNAEDVQDVPVTVQVVTGDSLQKLAITSVEEVSKIAPGLTLVNAGSNTSVTLRGVTWLPGSGTPATPIYLNDIAFDPAQVIVSLFDVGQIEVLRGPQGTSRGAPSISGAVTITTRKPDLNEFGGYVQGLYGSGDHTDLQGAINVPIIKDVLAVRLAANIEDSNGSRIESVNSAIKSSYKDRSYRATVLLTPTDTLSFQAMYQQRKSRTLNFTQVAGTGSPGQAGFPGIRPTIAANFNGPALTAADRASVQDFPSINDQHIDLLTFNASWDVLGHNVS